MSHSLISPSNLNRCLHCPPSARLAETIPDTGSTYAEEGTAAHALAENRLGETLDLVSIPCTWSHDTVPESEYHSPEMNDYIDGYVAEVLERVKDLPDAHVMLEQRLKLDDYIPNGFGTADVIILSEPVLHVIDLKYGKGVEVDATENPQLMLYGLGALEAVSTFYDINTVQVTIVQPRLEHVSTYEITADALRAWGRETVAPAAKLAWDGEGDFAAGEWCRFCPASGSCRARADANIEYAREAFSAEPPTLTLDEVGDILTHLTEWEAWAKRLREYAEDQALNFGAAIPGWKVVEGRSNRKYTDETAVAHTLRQDGVSHADIYVTKLKGITEMTRLLGTKRFHELLDPYIEKPPGKPVLVPETDKRPAINVGAVFTDITEEIKNG